MDYPFNQDMMKGPTRPAPPAPGFAVNRYSPVTNWNDDPFGADVFEPNPQYAQKKKPPPRPPPPKINQPDIPNKPSHFLRRPTVLSNLLSRRNKNASQNQSSINNQGLLTDFPSEVDSSRMFPKCEPKSLNTGTLIDLSSPPSSPTFTTRSSSDGLSVDSFGSDATSSTNHHNAFNGGSTSQAESGFEDDFDLFLSSRKPISKDDTMDDFVSVDPFSPPNLNSKPAVMKKPVFSKDLFDTGSAKSSQIYAPVNGPTIIRAKPARPKPPDSVTILKHTLGNSLAVANMSLNVTTPIQKVNSFSNAFEDDKPLEWESEDSPDRETSPPMPTIPPPPPPPIVDDNPVTSWPDDFDQGFENGTSESSFENGMEEPYAVALFDYSTGHPDDLEFKVHDKIILIRRETDEWLYGKLPHGRQGLFPANYVEVKVPLPDDTSSTPLLNTATALYDFNSEQAGDLSFSIGDTITIINKISDEWYMGKCNGVTGQFPVNYVQMHA